jgi:hypothetical protein
MLEWRRVLYGFSNKGRAGTKALLRASICPRPNSLFKAVFSLYKIKYTRKIDDYKEDVTAARWPAQKHSDNRREQFHGLEIIIFFRIFFFCSRIDPPCRAPRFHRKKEEKKEEKKPPKNVFSQFKKTKCKSYLKCDLPDAWMPIWGYHQLLGTLGSD